ncbi:MAG: flagellar hook-length control protein FliK [Rubrivivax sp.]|nr:flagellar hook-length control protein FliK [Rubrivivax sp.]
MNLIPVLAGVMPVRAAAAVSPGDSRLPPATSSRDAAGPAGGFARALSEAGAPGRSTSGAAPDDNGQPAEGSRAGDDHEAPTAGTQSAPAAPAEAASPAPPSPPRSTVAASAQASAANAGHAASVSSPTQKVRAVVLGGAASPALTTESPHSEGSTPTDTPTAQPAETATPAGAAEAANLLAELQARHAAQAATPTQANAAVDHEDDASAGALRLPQRRLVAAAAPTDKPALPEPVNTSATARNALSIETPSPATNHGPVAESMAVTLPAGALPPYVGPTAALQPGLGAAPAAEARLTAAPGSAEFSTQLGSQLTTFVRDGVQHARLHLNPAEMGPVTVQIRIDGQAAQVHLAAEHGLTRQALEQSMPLLAGSLREAGLTLSGGGVFEQPRQSRDEAPPGTAAGNRPSREGSDDVALRPGPTPVHRRGVVDLVA